MDAQTEATATQSATSSGGVVLSMSEYQRNQLRKAGMIATSPSLWFRYWLPIRWMMYPFANMFWWLDD